MAKGYLIRTDDIMMEEMEFQNGTDICKAIGCELLDRTTPAFPISMEQNEAFPKIDIWCDDIGTYGGKPNIDNIHSVIYGNVVLLGRKMTPDGMDIADLDYKDAKVMLDRLCVTQERRETYMRYIKEADEINKDAVMGEHSIATGIAFDVPAETLAAFKKQFFEEIDRTDGAVLDAVKSDEVTNKYVRNGWTGKDLHVFEESEKYVLTNDIEEESYPPGYIGLYMFKGNGEDEYSIDAVPVDGMKLATYAKEKYGMVLNPQVVEFGTVREDGKFYLEKSESRKILLCKDVKTAREKFGVRMEKTGRLANKFKTKNKNQYKGNEKDSSEKAGADTFR